MKKKKKPKTNPKTNDEILKLGLHDEENHLCRYKIKITKQILDDKNWTKGSVCLLPHSSLSPFVKPDTPVSEAIYYISRSYLTKHAGLNRCAHFTSKVLRATGFNIYNYNVTKLYGQLINSGFTEVSKNDIKRGDIVMVLGVHVGIASSNTNVIHDSTGAGYSIHEGKIKYVFDTSSPNFKVLRPPHLKRGDICNMSGDDRPEKYIKYNEHILRIVK